MKRIFIALAVLLTVQFADAQVTVKPAAAAKKAVESSEAAANDPKKATKVATWIKLAKAYMDAYVSPKGQGVNMLGMGVTSQEIQLTLVGEKPSSVEPIKLGGEPATKEIYSTREYIYNRNGQFAFINVTKPLYKDPLAKALNAYKKAYEVDLKKSKEKDITAGIKTIADSYYEDGLTAYMLGDNAKACKLFGLAADASLVEPYNTINTDALYNAGFTALAINDIELAKTFFERCVSHNFYYENGEVYAKLGEIYTQLGQTEKSVAVLEEGFVKFPQSQSILIGLINFYLSSKQDTARLFELISAAKANEPTNASLYYVEGNIYNELRGAEQDEAKKNELFAAAVNSYNECVKVDPEYEFGYIGNGMIYYNYAVELQDKAALEMDNTKYEVLIKQMEESLSASIEPFEKAYSVAKDNELKISIAEYLKNIYYRFSSKSDEYMQGYKKYDNVVKTGQVQ